VPPLAYGLATLTAVSRVDSNDHWTSDVFLGAVIGYVTSKALHHLHTRALGTTVALRPMSTSGGGGLALDFKF